MKRLVLLGAGHGHLLLLQHWAKQPAIEVELVVISPEPWQYYSGMIPGWVAGVYALEQCRIAVELVVNAAGGQFIEQAAIGLDAEGKTLTLNNSETINYDWLSIDIGSSTPLAPFKGYEGPVISIKPLSRFQQQWQAAMEVLRSDQSQRLVVVGGGAGGAELALAIADALGTSQLPSSNASSQVSLVTGKQGLLPGFNPHLRRLLARQMRKANVHVINADVQAEGSRLQLSNGEALTASWVVAATGAKPKSWLAESELKLDEDGYILVDAYHRSLSHPEVFAVGDTCSREDVQLNRSGVHAIRAGEVLADNLYQFVAAAVQPDKTPSSALRPFHPRAYTLYLLSCGSRAPTLGCYGPLSFSGRWVWYWKDAIDRRFVDQFQPVDDPM